MEHGRAGVHNTFGVMSSGRHLFSSSMVSPRASELILEWRVGEARPEGSRAGVGFLERGQPAPPHQLGGLWECCKLP